LEDDVIRARAGDKEAFACLAAKLSPEMKRQAACWFPQQPEDQEDAVQEALAIAFEKMPQLRDVQKFEPWVYRVFQNVCKKIRIKNKRRADLGSILLESSKWHENYYFPDSDVWRQIESLEVEEEIRVILKMRFIEGLPIPAIASQLNISKEAVKYRLRKGRHKLRDQLDLYNDEGV
jgi:RNA polymerase sigma-70 factor (ECF subfamily)